LGDLDDQIVIFHNLAKDWMGRRSAGIVPIQKGIVIDIDKELRSSRLRTSRVGHAQGSGGVGDFLVGFAHFIGDATVTSASVGLAIEALKLGVGIGATRSGATAVGVLGVGASKLKTECRE